MKRLFTWCRWSGRDPTSSNPLTSSSACPFSDSETHTGQIWRHVTGESFFTQEVDMSFFWQRWSFSWFWKRWANTTCSTSGSTVTTSTVSFRFNTDASKSASVRPSYPVGNWVSFCLRLILLVGLFNIQIQFSVQTKHQSFCINSTYCTTCSWS